MTFIRIPSLFAAGLVLAGLSSSATAQFSLNQDFATVGSRLVITADEGDIVDFGEKKAKVFLSQPGSKKKNNLKVLSWTNNQIEVQVKKAKVDPEADNEYDVTVQPKGKGVEAIVREDALTLRLIELPDGVAESTPSIATEGIVAQYQTDKAPKAKIGGKPSKIENWAPFGGPEGIQGAGTFDIIPHKKLANGVYDLELKTKAGKVLFEDAVTITGSTQGKPKKTGVSGTFGKFKFKPHPKVAKELVAIKTLTDTQITAVANKGTKVTYQLLLKLDWFPEDGDAILTENDLLFDAIQFQVNTIKGSLFNPTISTDFYTFTDATLSVCVSGDRILGTFNGTMAKNVKASNGNGPATLEVTKGEFNLPVANP
jgi:hypothetical protein